MLSGERDAGGGREVPSVQFQEARTQSGGRSWWEMHHLLILLAPGLMPGTGYREAASYCPVCRAPSPGGEGATMEDTEKKLTVRPCCLEENQPEPLLEMPGWWELLTQGGRVKWSTGLWREP